MHMKEAKLYVSFPQQTVSGRDLVRQRFITYDTMVLFDDQ